MKFNEALNHLEHMAEICNFNLALSTIARKYKIDADKLQVAYYERKNRKEIEKISIFAIIVAIEDYLEIDENGTRKYRSHEYTASEFQKYLRVFMKQAVNETAALKLAIAAVDDTKNLTESGRCLFILFSKIFLTRGEALKYAESLTWTEIREQGKLDRIFARNTVDTLPKSAQLRKSNRHDESDGTVIYRKTRGRRNGRKKAKSES